MSGLVYGDLVSNRFYLLITVIGLVAHIFLPLFLLFSIF
jgi:hypothetical protein